MDCPLVGIPQLLVCGSSTRHGEPPNRISRAIRNWKQFSLGVRVSTLADYLSQLDHCLTAPELARLLKIHKIQVYRLAAAGEIPSFKIASSVRFDPRAVAKWLRAQAVQQ